MKKTLGIITLTTLIAVPLLLGGCRFNRLSSWEKTQLENQATDDIDGFVAQFNEFGGGIDEASTSRSDERYLWEDCIVGYAGCQRCYSIEGDAAGGAVSMEQVVPDDQDDCSASLTLNDVFYGFTIDEWAWAGTWLTLEDGLYDVEWAGVQSATLVIEGSDNNDGTYEYDYEMNLATGVTDGDGELSEWTVDYDYNGYLDHDWHVVCAKDATGAIAGTITGDAAECVISGQDYDYVVDCE